MSHPPNYLKPEPSMMALVPDDATGLRFAKAAMMACNERVGSLPCSEAEEICLASVNRQATIRAPGAFLESFLTA
jgi:hypothetical protein